MGNILSDLIPMLSQVAVEEWKTMIYLSLGLIGPAHALSTSTLPHLTVVIQVVVTISQAATILTIVAACALIFKTRGMSAGDLEPYINNHPTQARLPTLCFFVAATSLLVAASVVHYRAVIAAGAIILAFFAWKGRAQACDGVKSLYSNVVDKTTQVLRGKGARPAPDTAEP